MQVAKNTPELPVRAPRAHLEGLELGKNFSLPSLDSVRADAIRCEFCACKCGSTTDWRLETAKEMQERPEDFEDIVFRTSLNSKTELPTRLRLPLVFNNLVPNLFRFSYFAIEQDGKGTYSSISLPLIDYAQFRKISYTIASGRYLCSYAWWRNAPKQSLEL
jgi:hypothetical protein